MSSDTAKGTGNNTPIGRIHRFLIPIEDVFNLIAAAAIFGLMVLGVLQITLRSIFNKPIVGYIDLVELSMATMAFLGAAYCQRLASHIRMEILIGRLRGRFLWFVEAAGLLAAMFIISVLIWYGWDHFMRAYELGDSTIDAEYPVWPSKLLVPVAFALWFLRLAIQFFGAVRLFINPEGDRTGAITTTDVVEQARNEIRETFGEEGLAEGDRNTT